MELEKDTKKIFFNFRRKVAAEIAFNEGKGFSENYTVTAVLCISNQKSLISDMIKTDAELCENMSNEKFEEI